MLSWPKENKKLIDKKLEDAMDSAQKIVEAANALRHEERIKARWPLRALTIDTKQSLTYLDNIIKFMTNVKEINYKGLKECYKDIGIAKIYLDTKLDEGLKQEALLREIIRKVQDMRKKGKLVVKDTITLVLENAEEMKKHQKYLMKEVGAKKIIFGKAHQDTLDFEGRQIGLEIKA